jgi:hypothetical protein
MVVALLRQTGTEGIERDVSLLRPRAGYTRATWRTLGQDSVHLTWAQVNESRQDIMVYATNEIRGIVRGDTLHGTAKHLSDPAGRPEGETTQVVAPRVGCPSARALARTDSLTRYHVADTTIVGTWRLVELSDWDSTGRLTQFYGALPRGLLIYTATGQVSVHLAGGEGSNAPYAGYFGTYTIDARRGVVTHRVEGGSFGTEDGSSPDRPFRISGDTLTLGDGRTWRRTFVRVR